MLIAKLLLSKLYQQKYLAQSKQAVWLQRLLKNKFLNK